MSRGTCRHHAAGIEDCAHAARTYADLCKGALTGVVAAYPHAYGDTETCVRTTQTHTHSCNAHGWRRLGVSEGSPYLHEQAKDKSGTCPFSRRTAHLPDVKDDGSSVGGVKWCDRSSPNSIPWDIGSPRARYRAEA
ncbi:hypothetical protein G5I_02234 [Acromyrmex echinatior]|uniref:Uncharacterized protein n=1 Tax=Acromyrmex echinatior TaxID=103372 RepID=F4W9S7_ACREC|nr:hypothetical protein G5I_02234 [Acromyrmex echinatior]